VQGFPRHYYRSFLALEQHYTSVTPSPLEEGWALKKYNFSMPLLFCLFEPCSRVVLPSVCLSNNCMRVGLLQDCVGSVL